MCQSSSTFRGKELSSNLHATMETNCCFSWALIAKSRCSIEIISFLHMFPSKLNWSNRKIPQKYTHLTTNEWGIHLAMNKLSRLFWIFDSKTIRRKKKKNLFSFLLRTILTLTCIDIYLKIFQQQSFISGPCFACNHQTFPGARFQNECLHLHQAFFLFQLLLLLD